jgi:hypothetical protein
MEERERKRSRGARTLTAAAGARACAKGRGVRACTESMHPFFMQQTSRGRGGWYRVAVCILIAVLPQLAAARHSN